MHYINPSNRQKRCKREDKFVVIHRFAIHSDFGGTVPIFRALSLPFWHKPTRNQRHFPCANLLLSRFSEITSLQRQKS